MKIWLDDERELELWKSRLDYLGNDWIWVKTAEEAIKCLETGTVTHISFDHDLGTSLTGYDVAKWIEEKAAHGKCSRLQWMVHTANPVGSIGIRLALLSAETFWSSQEAARN